MGNSLDCIGVRTGRIKSIKIVAPPHHLSIPLYCTVCNHAFEINLKVQSNLSRKIIAYGHFSALPPPKKKKINTFLTSSGKLPVLAIELLTCELPNSFKKFPNKLTPL